MSEWPQFLKGERVIYTGPTKQWTLYAKGTVLLTRGDREYGYAKVRWDNEAVTIVLARNLSPLMGEEQHD